MEKDAVAVITMSNSFGKILTLTTFGESHGQVVGGVLDGFPAGITIDETFVYEQLQRRKEMPMATPRKEDDKPEFLSGIYEGRSTGAPIAFIIKNNQFRSADYDDLRDVFRPSHADYTYLQKYGLRDHRGGGRSSARTLVVRIVAGCLAQMALQQQGIKIHAYVSQIGNLQIADGDLQSAEPLLRDVASAGDSIGGCVQCIATGCPIGLGEPEFDKLHASLAQAMMSIHAAKGFEIGDGFALAAKRGSEANDCFTISNNQIRTTTNHSGGVLGGISNGEEIVFRVAFKPIPSIQIKQQTVNTASERCEIAIKGRHDVCAAPRAVPVVECMTALVLLDALLLHRSRKNFSSLSHDNP